MKLKLGMSIAYFLLAIALPFVLSCSRPAFLAGIGTGGKYLEARDNITRKRGGDIDKAIVNLETVVREDPLYKDSLTLLGRAYYMKARYEDARLILERAVVVDKEDEIAWLVLGIAQLRLGQDEKGLATVQGGITLFSKISVDGYKRYQFWDRAGKVKTVLRRGIFVARKGLEDKENLIRSVENLLAAIDEEEWTQGTEQTIGK